MDEWVFYPHLGMVFFNTFLPDARENVAVAFRSGKFFAGHQHNDLNTFNINAYGDKLAIDGGYYDWFGSKHHKAYTIQSVAHNTILFNGKGQNGTASAKTCSTRGVNSLKNLSMSDIA